VQQAFGRVVAEEAGVRPGEEDMTKVLAGESQPSVAKREEHQSV
jgi:hypothetical protein